MSSSEELKQKPQGCSALFQFLFKASALIRHTVGTAYGPVMQQLVARPEAVAQSLAARRGLFFTALLQFIEVSCMHSSVKVQPLGQASSALCSTFCVIQVSPGFICGHTAHSVRCSNHQPPTAVLTAGEEAFSWQRAIATQSFHICKVMNFNL